MGRFGVAEPAIGEPQDAGYDKHDCCQLACIHINLSLPRPTIALATFQRKSNPFQSSQVQRATTKQSDESYGNQVKSDGRGTIRIKMPAISETIGVRLRFRFMETPRDKRSKRIGASPVHCCAHRARECESQRDDALKVP
jgi:hypothetical protein